MGYILCVARLSRCCTLLHFVALSPGETDVQQLDRQAEPCKSHCSSPHKLFNVSLTDSSPCNTLVRPNIGTLTEALLNLHSHPYRTHYRVRVLLVASFFAAADWVLSICTSVAVLTYVFLIQTQSSSQDAYTP